MHRDEDHGIAMKWIEQSKSLKSCTVFDAFGIGTLFRFCCFFGA